MGIQIVKALLANTRGHSDSATEEVIELVEDIPAQAGNTLYRGLPCIGPVLIICFTNHALDQFLEGLVAAGLTSLVRVGGRYDAQHVLHIAASLVIHLPVANGSVTSSIHLGSPDFG